MKVKLEPGEHPENLIKRFTRKIKKSELIKQLQERRYFKKKSQIKKEKERARKRVLEKLREENRDSNN